MRIFHSRRILNNSGGFLIALLFVVAACFVALGVHAASTRNNSIVVGGTVPSAASTGGGGGGSNETTPPVVSPEIQNPEDREILGLPPLPPPAPPAPPTPPTPPPAPPVQSPVSRPSAPPGAPSNAGSMPLVNIEGRLGFDNVGVLIGNGSIPSGVYGGRLNGASGDLAIVWIDRSDLSTERGIQGVTIAFGGVHVNLVYDAGTDTYRGRIAMPAPGEYPAVISVRYADGAFDALSFALSSQPYGLVTDSFSREFVAGAEVFLYDENAGGYLWPPGVSGQPNPAHTGQLGTYRFIVPNGTYRLMVKKDGYRDRETFTFVVANNVVNQTIRLIKRSDGSVLGLTTEGLSLVEQALLDLARKARELADNPAVEEAVEKVVTPVAVSIVGASVGASLWSSVFPLLRYVFLQPLLFLGIRKRKDWGLVYNSLSKLPVDLATVRLINAETSMLMRSQVTDKNGRYAFLVPQGHYIVRAEKKGYIFPTHVLAKILADGLLANVYHGDTIEIKEDGFPILVNIPIDPSGKEKTPTRILWEKRLRLLQQLLSYTGIVTTAISLYIKPSLTITAYLFGHIFLFVLFIRFVNPRKPKGWGTVTDAETGKPISKAIVRLYHGEYSKLVATEMTTGKGRYVFLVGPGSFYTTYEKAGYEPYHSPVFSFADESRVGGLVKKNVTLSRSAGTAPPEAVPPSPAPEQTDPQASEMPKKVEATTVFGAKEEEELRRQVREWWESAGSHEDPSLPKSATHD